MSWAEAAVGAMSGVAATVATFAGVKIRSRAKTHTADASLAAKTHTADASLAEQVTASATKVTGPLLVRMEQQDKRIDKLREERERDRDECDKRVTSVETLYHACEERGRSLEIEVGALRTSVETMERRTSEPPET